MYTGAGKRRTRPDRRKSFSSTGSRLPLCTRLIGDLDAAACNAACTGLDAMSRSSTALLRAILSSRLRSYSFIVAGSDARECEAAVQRREKLTTTKDYAQTRVIESFTNFYSGQIVARIVPNRSPVNNRLRGPSMIEHVAFNAQSFAGALMVDGNQLELSVDSFQLAKE